MNHNNIPPKQVPKLPGLFCHADEGGIFLSHLLRGANIAVQEPAVWKYPSRDDSR